jgi:thiol-disulfide isomerase/thioredoxin
MTIERKITSRHGVDSRPLSEWLREPGALPGGCAASFCEDLPSSTLGGREEVLLPWSSFRWPALRAVIEIIPLQANSTAIPLVPRVRSLGRRDGVHPAAIRIASTAMTQSIAGQPAPELAVPYWIDAEGKERLPLTLKELGARHRLLFFYQHWCGGCHSHGFPTLQALVQDLTTNVGFAAIQTAFEGAYVNTRDRLPLDQQHYDLRIPFGHEGRSSLGAYPTTMENYCTGGTPWFVAINPDGVVLQDGFAIDIDRFIRAVAENEPTLR